MPLLSACWPSWPRRSCACAQAPHPPPAGSRGPSWHRAKARYRAEGSASHFDINVSTHGTGSSGGVNVLLGGISLLLELLNTEGVLDGVGVRALVLGVDTVVGVLGSALKVVASVGVALLSAWSDTSEYLPACPVLGSIAPALSEEDMIAM